MQTQNSFSTVLIVRNEAMTLPRLVASLHSFQETGGEIVVVDTGSADGTASIARSLGCTVHEVGERFLIKVGEDIAERINERFIVEGEEPVIKAGDRIFDYSSARNYAASLASNDMVFMPDADEILTSLNLSVVNGCIGQGVEQLEYPFIYAHDEYGRPSVQFTHSKFYNRTKLHWEGVIHECLHGTASKCVLPEQVMKLEHFQNESTDRSGYLRGLAYDCFISPANDRNSHYFGRELLFFGRPLSAIQELERHLGMNGWAAERSQSLCFIGEALLKLQDERGAILAFQEAFSVEGGRREPLMRLADLYYQKHDAQHTAAYAMAALSIPLNGFYYNQIAHYEHMPHEMLYWSLWQLGDLDGAKHHFRKALKYRPNHPKYLEDKKFFIS